MSTGSELSEERFEGPESRSGPAISACRSGPETVVFLESGNTDGWIATDWTVEPSR